MKIAFATSDSTHVNAHFGWAPKLDVYDATPNGYTFLETRTFGGDLKEDGDEDKLEPKLKALRDCTIVYVSAIGPSAAARLINKNITPVKAEVENEEITSTLDHLVQILQGSPPPWLRKALQQDQKHNFEAAFDDEFEETEEEVLV